MLEKPFCTYMNLHTLLESVVPEGKFYYISLGDRDEEWQSNECVHFAYIMYAVSCAALAIGQCRT